MSNFLKLASISVNGLDSSETVKIAGILRKVKNWIKSKFNTEYKNELDKINYESIEFKSILKNLGSEIDEFTNAINDFDTQTYNVSLIKIKEMLVEAYKKLKIAENTFNKIKYKEEDLDNPELLTRIQETLPKGFELGFINKRLNEIKPFDAFDVDNIDWGTTSKTILTSAIKENEKINYELSYDSVIDIKNAILNGIIFQSKRKDPDEKRPEVYVGTIELTGRTDNINLPGLNNSFNISFTLIWGANAREKLIVSKMEPNFHNKSKKNDEDSGLEGLASLKNYLNKIAAEVPYKVTTLSEVELAKVLREAYKVAFGNDPTAEALAGGWSQVCMENGRPAKLPGNNFGNIKATNDWVNSGNDYFVKSTQENTSEGKSYIHQDAKWRAYKTPLDGAVGYWKLLGKRYKSSLDWMAAGDPSSASVSLAFNKYYTANIQTYTKGVSSLYNYFMKNIAPSLSGLKSLPTVAPGEKPEVKQWVSQYSKEEKEKTNQPEIKPEEVDMSELDKEIRKLYSSSKLTSFVKNALLKKSLPETKLLLKINSLCKYEDNLKFAKILSNTLQEFANAKTVICSNKDEIEVECKVYNTNKVAIKSIQALCDSVSEGSRYFDNKNIDVLVVPEIKSVYAELDTLELYKNG